MDFANPEARQLQEEVRRTKAFYRDTSATYDVLFGNVDRAGLFASPADTAELKRAAEKYAAAVTAYARAVRALSDYVMGKTHVEAEIRPESNDTHPDVETSPSERVRDFPVSS